MSRIDYQICGRQPSRFPSLTDELGRIGVSHEPCAHSGRRQLWHEGARVGPPIDAASGWQFVRLVQCGAGISAETVAHAIDAAASDINSRG